MRIILIGNYPPDQQWSMRRFTGQLKEGVEALGASVEVYLPPVIVGKLGARGYGLGKWLGYVDKYLITPTLLRRKLRRVPPNTIVHICDHSNSIYVKALGKRPHLITCHDLLAIRSAHGEISQNQTKWSGRLQQKMILKGLKRSRQIVSVSEATRRDVARLVGNRSELQYLVPNSLNDDFIEETQAGGKDREKKGPPRRNLFNGMPYIIHIGGEKWYKNRSAVLEIFASLQKDGNQLQLVVVGPRFSDAALEKSGCLQMKEKIHYFSGISDHDLRGLYRNAELLLFPSLIEGFGWPILEAQACGCPVATFAIEPMSSLNALPELTAGDGTGGNDDIIKLVAACQNQLVLSHRERSPQKDKIRQFAAKFSNQASAEAYMEIYRGLLLNAGES
ncbi:glycosyltransferase family 1 protein [Coraliomargarita sinensis]|uniref:Glycosyltransferase family 1 protein n=1 Tax=Coraliomargarita sinensis TaxID=2174842 RepID=A0A317ZJV6_9BACT|nr:glycosyltransferase family 1 protein [Coraliomargarita sinensis]PXA04218.1 glycosyltransferase family 1 protein [Coraliomargarita sinensis]